MTDKENNNDLWSVVRALQREAGRGTAKAVQVTVFFDSHGRLVGRTETKTVKLFPSNVMDVLKLMFNNIDD